ncbi:MAG: hypothetical protein WD077_12870 [Bacteroidia bacterium]
MNKLLLTVLITGLGYGFLHAQDTSKFMVMVNFSYGQTSPAFFNAREKIGMPTVAVGIEKGLLFHQLELTDFGYERYIVRNSQHGDFGNEQRLGLKYQLSILPFDKRNSKFFNPIFATSLAGMAHRDKLRDNAGPSIYEKKTAQTVDFAIAVGNNFRVGRNIDIRLTIPINIMHYTRATYKRRSNDANGVGVIQQDEWSRSQFLTY